MRWWLPFFLIFVRHRYENECSFTVFTTSEFDGLRCLSTRAPSFMHTLRYVPDGPKPIGSPTVHPTTSAECLPSAHSKWATSRKPIGRLSAQIKFFLLTVTLHWAQDTYARSQSSTHTKKKNLETTRSMNLEAHSTSEPYDFHAWALISATLQRAIAWLCGPVLIYSRGFFAILVQI